ncbi:MAG: NTP transferase domain-containing protein [Methylococcales bacterium]|nr:NTP transferase domain-containing protein [Methylococcales bacterium]MBT7445262.1 NTP transferase domain-containing protein [Methylococcales bacterium]
MKAIAIIVARLNSSRLPGKHLLPLAGRPHIEHVFKRLRETAVFSDIVLATTADHTNDEFVEWCQSHSQSYYAHTGDEDNLLARVDKVVTEYNPDVIVYVCGDCPLIEPETVANMVIAAADNAGDIVRLEGYPNLKTIHEGFDCYTRAGWDKLVDLSTSEAAKEHVGVAFKTAPDVKNIMVKDDPIFAEIQHRISVDTRSDYDFMSAIYELWYSTHNNDEIVSLRWVIDMLQNSPNLGDINRHVQQKEVGVTYDKYLILLFVGDSDGQNACASVDKLMLRLQDGLSAGCELLVYTRDGVLKNSNIKQYHIFNQRNDFKAVVISELESGQYAKCLLVVEDESVLNFVNDISDVINIPTVESYAGAVEFIPLCELTQD